MTWLADRWALSYLIFHRRLAKAAGISAVTVVCHPETWAAVTRLGKDLADEYADGANIPAQVADGGEVTLSGASIVAVMHVLRIAWFCNTESGWPYRRFPAPRRAVARRVYLALAQAVGQVTADPDGAAPRAVLDDRMPQAGT